MGIYDSILGVYDRHYKPLMIAPFIILVIALVILGGNYFSTGDFIQKGISLSGGISVTFDAPEGVNSEELSAKLSAALPQSDVNIRKLGDGELFSVEASHADENELLDALASEGITLDKGRYSVETFGSALGEDFFRQTIWAAIAAFAMMAIVVFLTFRVPVPSAMVVLAAVCTIIETLATLDVIGVRLNTAGVAAFLMLIGYSVDTDILLTTRVIKRNEGTIFERIVGASKTGMLMTLTAFVAALVGYYFTESSTIQQIMLILAIGMFYDMINTWLQNAGLLRWYVERKEAKHVQD